MINPHARPARAMKEGMAQDKNQCSGCAVHQGTHKPAEALHQQIDEPQAVAVLDERAAFEQWLGINPCGAEHDFGWEAWKARAALASTPAAAPTDEPVFLQRLRVEQQELDARQQKLGAFIESSEFRLLSETDAALLSKQEALQHVLLQTLNQRIHSASEKHMREKRNA